MRSFMSDLKAAATVKTPPPPTPPAYLAQWREKLKDLRGVVGSDGWERITTASVLSLLDVPAREQLQAARKLAPLMTEFGWMRARMRGLHPLHPHAPVRGYARNPKEAQHKEADENSL